MAGRDSGVRFNPMVTVMGGSEIPLASGDGCWNTLQYEQLQTQDSAMSLSFADIVEDREAHPTGRNYFNSDQGSSSGSESPEGDMVEVELTGGVHPDDKAKTSVASDRRVRAIQGFIMKHFGDSDDGDRHQEVAATQAPSASLRTSPQQHPVRSFRQSEARAAVNQITHQALRYVHAESIGLPDCSIYRVDQSLHCRAGRSCCVMLLSRPLSKRADRWVDRHYHRSVVWYCEHGNMAKAVVAIAAISAVVLGRILAHRLLQHITQMRRQAI
jgi:hypothetical protein